MARCMILLLALAAPAVAADRIALSPEAREAAIEAGAAQAPINGLPGVSDGRPHGEMGIMAGSNGMRAIYGDTVIPLGGDATLGLSFVDARGGRWRGR